MCIRDSINAEYMGIKMKAMITGFRLFTKPLIITNPNLPLRRFSEVVKGKDKRVEESLQSKPIPAKDKEESDSEIVTSEWEEDNNISLEWLKLINNVVCLCFC
eukprot:TRINITY_DN4187_c0_g2_i1.p1 TRINITY_DN4187_c0_g2~~TRINITY_DN4187_c0_g2_i1.p1  ORF type:complete len:103 (-),score=26.56 TRINITY_DN4187_c0_g2_i1:166-474(-)